MTKSALLEVALTTCAAFVVSLALTGLVRKFALMHGLMDKPNARSSHSAPTPRGGGLAIALSTLAGFAVMRVTHALDPDVFMALGGGGTAVALIGFLDDRRPRSAGIRLAVHAAAALWAVVWLGGLPSLRFGTLVLTLGWSGYLLGVLGLVWTLNLFNFMDGIDGLAASEAVFVTWGAALISLSAGILGGATSMALVLGGACMGFLIWNWPKARIFMGDVGSGYIGFSIGVLALAFARDESGSLLGWLILGGAFFIDATVTFVRRLIRGERITDAHRSHAYQHLARRWKSHKKVTVSVLLLNIFWLFPWALVASRLPHSHWAIWAPVVALTPLVVLFLFLGSGRTDSR